MVRVFAFMTTIQIPNNWMPRDYQMNVWDYLEGGGKRAVSVWHRRAGKDDVCLHWGAKATVLRPATYWHMLPEASQARKAIWDAVNPHTGIRRIDEAFPKGFRDTTREQEMMIRTKTGSTWQVVGSDNFNSLVGSPPAGVVFSEWPLSNPDAWAYLRPILAENGGWALFVYKPRGPNHGKTTYDFALKEKDWFAELLTADKTGVFTEEQLETEKREYISQYGVSRGLALFNQEYMCSWDPAFTGKAVYPEFDRETHVSKVPLLPIVTKGIENGHTTVIRGWDHTGLHPACVATYLMGNQWLVFKEFWEEDLGIEDFGDLVKIWCAQNLPPDTTYTDIGDPAGNKTRDATKQTPADYVRKHCGINIRPGIQTFKIRRESVANRLNRRNGFLMDPTECSLLLSGFLGGYGYPEIGHSGVFKDTISGSHKDKYCDVHDALQYPATKIFGPSRPQRIEMPPPQPSGWMSL